MDYLPASVNSGVCAARAVDHRLCASDARNRLFKHSLDCWSVSLGLALKAAIVGAIVLNATRQLDHNT